MLPIVWQRRRRGEFHIYACDFNGTVIAHGGNATLVGQNLLWMTDPKGTYRQVG